MADLFEQFFNVRQGEQQKLWRDDFPVLLVQTGGRR